MKILFTCGGTGGHINPAVSIAKMIRQRHPGADICFVGALEGMETKLIPYEGFELKLVGIKNLRRSFTPKNIIRNFDTIFHISTCLREAEKILIDFRPDAVVGTGGYASFPTVYKASRMGIPTIIHESNASPGLATKILAKRADKILVSFEESAGYYKRKDSVIVTGTPVREGFIYTKKEDARRELGFGEKPLLVSFWGSLGAREMNKVIAKFIKLEVKDNHFHHIHAAGSFGFRWMPDMVKDLGVDLKKHKNVDLREYIYDMPAVLAAADLVICRGGASTISELSAAAKPSIIVPSPNVAGNHQEKNARVLEGRNASVVCLEKEITPEKLYNEVCKLILSPEKLENMSESLRNMAILDSGERIYKIIMDKVRGKA